MAEWLSTETRDQLLPWYVEFNWGAAVRTPWAKYDTTPPSDEKAEADRLSTVSQAVGAFSNANVPLDLERLAEKYEIPIDLVAAKDLQRNQLLQYHLTFGLLTINEAHTKWLGLPKIKGGDVIPVPAQTPSQEPTQARGDTPIRALAIARRAVDIRAQQDADDHLDDGVAYTDDLEAQAKVAARQLLRPGLEELVRLVKEAGAEEPTTEEERIAALRRVRAAALRAYDGMDPLLFTETMQRVEMMASMAGAQSALGEV